MTINQLIDNLYPVGTRRRDIFLKHAIQVADKAVMIARDRKLDIDLDLVRDAAMVHDIGIALTDAPSIDCHGTNPYLTHGYLGASLLRENGFDEALARVAERHTGAGITADEIVESGLPLPPRDFVPETLLERLICYADKFYSKAARCARNHSRGYANRWPSSRRRPLADLKRFTANSAKLFVSTIGYILTII